MSGSCSGRATTSASSALGAGRLSFRVRAIPNGAPRNPAVYLLVEDSTFRPEDGRRRVIDIRTLEAQFPKGLYPPSANSDGVVSVRVVDGVGKIEVGRVTKAERDKRFDVKIKAVAKASADDPPEAQCETTIRLGEIVRRVFDCFTAKDKVLMKVAVRFEKVVERWVYRIESYEVAMSGEGRAATFQGHQPGTEPGQIVKKPATVGRLIGIVEEGDKVRIYGRMNSSHLSCITDAIKVPPKY